MPLPAYAAPSLVLLADNTPTQNGTTSNQLGTPQSAQPSMAGRWRWSVQCAIAGPSTGSMTFSGSSPFFGSMTVASGGSATISDGRLQGASVSFKEHYVSRIFGPRVATWSGTLFGNTVSGSAAFTVEKCRFTLKR
jgi:hypothetical protein